MTTAEVERLAAAAETERDRVMILVLAYAGLRAGEVGGLRIGKPTPQGITGSTVRFPMNPGSSGSTDWLEEVAVRQGAKIVWDNGTTYLVIQTRPNESLQDVADRAKRVIAKVNEWVGEQMAKFNAEEEARRSAGEEAKARADALRQQLYSLSLD